MVLTRFACVLGVFALLAAPAWGGVENIRALLDEAGRMNSEGRQADAEPVARQALALAEGLGPMNSRQRERLLATAQQRLGVSLRMQGRHAEAETVLQAALGLAERAYGQDARLSVKTLMQLGLAIQSQGRYAEADRHLRAAVARTPQEPKDADSQEVWLDARIRLGRLQLLTGNDAEAEALLGTAWERVARGEDLAARRWRQTVALSLSALRQHQGRGVEAERYARLAAESAPAAWGERHPVSAEAYAELGKLLIRLGRAQEAEGWLRRAVEIIEPQAGQDYGAAAKPYAQLGRLLADRGANAEAEAMYAKALAVAEKSASIELQVQVLRDYARFLLDGGRPEHAQPLFDRAVAQADHLFALSRGLDAAARENKVSRLRPLYGEAVSNRVEMAERYPGKGHDMGALADVSRTQSRLFTEMLRLTAAASLAEDRDFIALKARRDDAVMRSSDLRRRLALTARRVGDDLRPSRPTDDPYVLARWQREVAALQRDITRAERDRSDAEAGLWRDFPRFMELEEPRPVSVTELRERGLRADETLLAYFRLRNRLLLFLVSQEEFRLLSIPVARQELDALVARARRPMESYGSTDGRTELDPGTLNRLYDLLLKPVQDRLPPGRKLLVVGDGPLYTLPFAMLVRRWSEADRARFMSARKGDLAEYGLLDYAGDHWRFSYLPSLAALVIQRARMLPRAQADGGFVAFADPVFERADAVPAAATLALLEGLDALRGGRVGIPRLPETADEVEAVSRLLGGPHSIFLREQAQESRVKRMDLGRARYLHFATHGLLGGDFARLNDDESGGDVSTSGADRARTLVVEGDAAAAKPSARGQPALVLTLVGDLSGEDGLLTMGEVLGLRMNVDLAVLSACNTAGELDGARNGEGFAGLTRAFMHAGARGLLVSHWSVDSLATRDLVTDFFRRLKAGSDPSQALGEAQSGLRAGREARSGLSRAHPFFWAPFVHVGD